MGSVRAGSIRQAAESERGAGKGFEGWEGRLGIGAPTGTTLTPPLQVIFITEYVSSGSLKQFLKKTKKNHKAMNARVGDTHPAPLPLRLLASTAPGAPPEGWVQGPWCRGWTPTVGPSGCPQPGNRGGGLGGGGPHVTDSLSPSALSPTGVEALVHPDPFSSQVSPGFPPAPPQPCWPC